MTVDPLARIVEAAAAAEHADTELHAAVTAARAVGVTWAAIGDALGITRQAAFQRFGKARPTSALRSGVLKSLGTLAVVLACVLTLGGPADAARRSHVYVTGDSISVGRGTTDPAHKSYADDATRILHRRVRVVGYAGRCLVTVGCDPTDPHVPLVDGFRSEVLHATPRPTVVVVEIGVNDLGHATDEQMIASYRDMIAEGRQAGVRVYLATITPQGAGLMWPSVWTDAQRDRINAWIRSMHRPHVDFARALGGQVMDPAFNSGDGLHPNNAGARAMGRTLARFLRAHHA